MNGPDPGTAHPMKGFEQVCYIKNTISNPQIEVGDYTYYDDPENSDDFERNVLYLFPFIGDKLIIGKFCALGRGVKFIMNGANHKLDGFSTYPFYIFGNGWEKATPQPDELSPKGNTHVGNDVWMGYDSLVMPGVTIGDGAIIASRSVVVSDIPPYTIAGGNPAKVIRQRFPDEIISELLDIAWWNWDIEKVTRNVSAVVSSDIESLRKAR